MEDSDIAAHADSPGCKWQSFTNRFIFATSIAPDSVPRGEKIAQRPRWKKSTVEFAHRQLRCRVVCQTIALLAAGEFNQE
jgi:hypothetical protein